MLVSVSEIFEREHDWHERHAEVYGIFTYALEDVTLRDADSGGKVLWVTFDPETTEIVGFELKDGCSKTVVVDGYISIGRAGHFGMCNGEIRGVMRIISAKRYFQNG